MSNPQFIPERYCTFSAQLAATIGLEEAVLLQGLSHQLGRGAQSFSFQRTCGDGLLEITLRRCLGSDRIGFVFPVHGVEHDGVVDDRFGHGAGGVECAGDVRKVEDWLIHYGKIWGLVMRLICIIAEF